MTEKMGTASDFDERISPSPDLFAGIGWLSPFSNPRSGQ
jgi:hypothetical protein